MDRTLGLCKAALENQFDLPKVREGTFTTLTPSARADFREGRSLKIILHTYIKNIKQLQHTDSTLLHGIFGITHK